MTLDWLRLILGGLIIGIVVAAPIGAVNLICMRRTLTYGPLNGFISGLGAAVGDGFFAIVAAFGLSALSEFILRYEGWLKLAGGIVLVALGLHTYFADPAKITAARRKGETLNGTDDLPHTVAATFLLTVTNPATLFAFTAIFAGAATELHYTQSAASAGFLAVGVIGGSALWWFVVTLAVGMLHGQLSDRWVHRVNQISGGAIALLGLIVLGMLIVPM